MHRRVLVIGLDSAPPRLLFNEFKDFLPNLSRLMDEGLWGILTSSHPPITVPAWMVMMTGRDPGELGLYGFRHRRGFSYRAGRVVTAASVKARAIWDVAEENRRRVCLIGVPPSYPPRRVNGWLISCFLTPGTHRAYTYPPSLAGEIERLVGRYVFDVPFRVKDRDGLLEELYAMTDIHFTAVRYLMQKDWDLMVFVEIGTDRVQHAFWKYFDRHHPRYRQGSRYENTIRDYYRYIDRRIGELLDFIDDDTVVLVVSDHGAKAMQGAFCINQWLVEEGYLVLKQIPHGVTDLDGLEVDWSRTRAWGWGGYYARIFFNVRDREPCGIIDPRHYEEERAVLMEKLKNIRDPSGRLMATRVYRPEELYRECRGNPPDLMVYLDDLNWRSAGTLGHGGLYLAENDTGPDDAVHDCQGVFILWDPRHKYGRRVTGAEIRDIAPTVLEVMGLPRPPGMGGRSLLSVASGSEAGNSRVGDLPAPVLWLTGLPGSGKSTLARALADELRRAGRRVEVLDGDEVRAALSPGLGFTREGREEHNRRVIYLARLLSRHGVTVVVSLISPYRYIRDLARRELQNFIEVWVKCSLDECVRRDPKGLYKKALVGEIKDLTGIQAPYEEPLCPEVVVDTEKESLERCVRRILEVLGG